MTLVSVETSLERNLDSLYCFLTASSLPLCLLTLSSLFPHSLLISSLPAVLMFFSPPHCVFMISSRLHCLLTSSSLSPHSLLTSSPLTVLMFSSLPHCVLTVFSRPPHSLHLISPHLTSLHLIPREDPHLMAPSPHPVKAYKYEQTAAVLYND